MNKYQGLAEEAKDHFRSFELHQMRINAYQMPLCIGHYRKIATDNSNWELYHDTKWGGIVSLAKPGSGATDSIWACKLNEVRRRVIDGRIPAKNVTKYGRRLLGLN